MKRPKGWDDLYLKAYKKEYLGKGYGSPERAMFEAGADAMLKEIYEWGEEDCPHDTTVGLEIVHWSLKRNCDECWQELLKEAG